MFSDIGNTNAHIIIRFSGSGTEARLRNFWLSSGFMARTGFLADNIHFCRARSGVHGKGVVFRHVNRTDFVDDRVDCLMDIGAQTQGSATVLLILTVYASGQVDQPNWTQPHGTVNKILWAK